MSLAAPLTDLLCKDAFQWTPKTTITFQSLKQVMMEALVLRLPKFNIKFVIETDASNTGIGAVLMQAGHPIAYYRKKMCPKLSAFSTHIKELYAITQAMQKWCQYLLGKFFIIRIDHKSIKELLQQVTQTPYQQVYIKKLLGYQFRIEYKLGCKNQAVDALSRVHEDSSMDSLIKRVACQPLINHAPPPPPSLF